METPASRADGAKNAAGAQETARTLVKGAKRLRCGYTTGSCAAAAAAAAVETLVSGRVCESVRITLPGGECVLFALARAQLCTGAAECAVRKDAGDDPDVTDGLLIAARASFADDAESGGAENAAPAGRASGETKPAQITADAENGGSGENAAETPQVFIEGGQGVGRVTQPGLKCAVGGPAINPVPRAMIRESCLRVLHSCGCARSVRVVISAPGGEQLAQKTFNPRLGIVGGISILGTTGIVEPMSEKALIASIQLCIDRRFAADPEKILITPGNWGQAFCAEHLGFGLDDAEQVSNYIGEALDYIRFKGFRRVLLVGHAGKLVKLAGGIMNTHSAVADCRTELLALYAGLAGADRAEQEHILACLTAQAALEYGAPRPWFAPAMRRIMAKIAANCARRAGENTAVAAVLFDNTGTLVFKTENADEMLTYFRRQP